jgi:hypothetical protein
MAKYRDANVGMGGGGGHKNWTLRFPKLDHLVSMD